jgi:hypothetical protein
MWRVSNLVKFYDSFLWAAHKRAQVTVERRQFSDSLQKYFRRTAARGLLVLAARLKGMRDHFLDLYAPLNPPDTA